MKKTKYSLNDQVIFKYNNEIKNGTILIVNGNGSLGSVNNIPSYDIFVTDENCLYKNIEEPQVFD